MPKFSDADPGCLSRIPEPNFPYPESRIRIFSIPDPGSASKNLSIPDAESRIPDPDPQHCTYFVYGFVFVDSLKSMQQLKTAGVSLSPWGIGSHQLYFRKPLKVGGNEKNGGSGRRQMLDNGLGPWRSRFIFILNMKFLCKMSYFRFRLY
jgi:hypothetical protein